MRTGQIFWISSFGEGPLWIIPAVGKESVENAKSGSCRERPVKCRTQQKNLLKEQEIREGIRLACMTEVYGDVEVELLKKERKHEVLTRGYLPEFEKDTFGGGYGIVIDIGTTIPW